MTARYSAPSASLGVNRFRVWPAGADAYNHTEQAANWDLTDAIIGIPAAGSAWPPTTGADGGIYREVKILQNERVPIGTVVAWFKASIGSTIPTGWAVCDGSTLLAANHDFPGVASSVTLPDLTNQFIIGADATKSIGVGSATVISGNAGVRSGAPGPQGTGGSNLVTLAVTDLPAHDHGGGSHTHDLNRQVKRLPGDFVAQPDAPYLINVRTTTTNIETTNSPSATVVALQGGGSAHENRPAHIGLIYLMKVKYITVP